LYGSNEAEPQQVTLHLIRLTISLTNSISWDDDRKGAIQRRNRNRNLSRKRNTLSSSTFRGNNCKGNSWSETVWTEGKTKTRQTCMSDRKTAPLPFLRMCRSTFRSDSLEDVKPSTAALNSTVDDVLKNFPYKSTSHREIRRTLNLRIRKFPLAEGKLHIKPTTTSDHLILANETREVSQIQRAGVPKKAPTNPRAWSS
jgi:hypothetical protein